MPRQSTRVYVGTSGFSYPEWKGSFYPQKLAGKEMLSFYASKLSTVEINNTFYRLPKGSVLQSWAEQTPDGFRFTIKASRRITHFKKLKDAVDLLTFLLTSLSKLGGRRGPVLFQLPPSMKADAGLLDEFLGALHSVQAELSDDATQLLPAFEFRHPSWFDDAVYAVLERRGAALVSGDGDESDREPPLVTMAPFSYLRLRRSDYSRADLDAWAERLSDLRVDAAYVYFKHEELGPQLAMQLQERLDR